MSDVEQRRLAVALHDRFTHGDGGLDRRAFMAALTRLAGGSAAAAALLSSIAADAQSPPQVRADDARLTSREDVLRFGDVQLRAYRSIRSNLLPLNGPSRRRPPAVIVIHENRGLNDHIRDVARRLALAGYDAAAPDFLSLDGGATPADPDAARTAIGALGLERVVDAGAALIRLFHEPQRIVRPFEREPTRVGIVGFCWGGAMVHRLAVAAGDALAAAVSFYGPAPAPGEATRVVAPELVILAGRDARVNASAGPWVEALRTAGKRVELREFADVDHAFHNDTSAARYNPAAAQDAWAATLAFFERHLRT